MSGNGSTTPGLRLLHFLGVDVRESERGLVGGLFLASLLLGVFQFSSKAVRQASYIDVLGADRLPFIYLTVAIVAYPVLRLYGMAVRRWTTQRVIAGSLVIIVAGLVLFWWWMEEPGPVVASAYYVWVAIATALVLTQLWSLTNIYLDARQARRLFGFIGAGSLLGGVLGGQVATWTRNSPRDALLVAAVMLVLMGWIVRRLDRHGEKSASITGVVPRPGIADAVKSAQSARGLEVLRSSDHLRLIAGILLITVIVAQIIDLQFGWVVETTRTTTADRVAAFGNVFSLMGIAAFFFQLLLTPRIHRSMGVGHAMRVLPAFVAVGSILVLAVGSASPALLVFAVGLLRIGDNGLRYSLDHVTRELLFVPVPATERAEAKGYVDVFIHRFGKALGALLLFSVTFGWVEPLQLTWLTLVLVVAWIALTVTARRHYLEALRTGLNDGRRWPQALSGGDDLAFDANDTNTLEILVESLGSADPARVLGSLDLLRSHGRAKLVPPLLLHHDDRDVRLRTLQVMVAAERRDALPLIERCVADGDADVRAEAIRALSQLSGRRGPEIMEDRLGDADPRIRAAAVHCILVQGTEEQRARAEAALQQLLTDADAAVRVEAAKALGGLPEPMMQQQVIMLLFDQDKDVARAMIVAMRGRIEGADRSPIYLPILISLLRDRRLKHEARDTLVAYGPTILPALNHFLNDENEQIWVRRAIPKTVAQFRGRGAAPVLWESLEHCEDLLLRTKIVEALRSIPDHAPDVHRLRRTLQRLARGYFEALVALESLAGGSFELRGTTLQWRDGAEPRPLVERLLEEHRRSHLRNMNSLLAMLLPGVALEELFAGSDGEDGRRSRSHAVEYLDNVLDGSLREEVLLVFDDLPPERRLQSAAERFGLVFLDRDDTLARLMDGVAGHEAERWLAAAAAHRVGELGLESLYPRVTALAGNEHSRLVRETAEFVVDRMIA